jgi:hypothetical protein
MILAPILDQCVGPSILVQTGQGVFPPNALPFSGFDSKVSVDSKGLVAFTGFAADGSNAGYVASAQGAVTQLTFSGSGNRVFGGASINDAAPPTAAFQERVSGSPPTFFIRSWPTDGSQQPTIIGKSTAAPGICGGGTRAGQVCQESNPDCPIFFGPAFLGYAACVFQLNSNIPFDSASFFQSENNNGVVAFPALVNGSAQTDILAGSSQASLNDVQAVMDGSVALRPQIADASPGNQADPSSANVVYQDSLKDIVVGFASSVVQQPIVIALNSQYSGSSQRPGISSDGQFVVFEATGPTAAGNLPAVFVARISAAGVQQLVPIPGLDTSGDPTTLTGQFTAFRPDTRYGVAATANGDGTYSLKIVFGATRSFTDSSGVSHVGVQGIYKATALFDPISNLTNASGQKGNTVVLTGGPSKLIEIGDAIPAGAAQHVSAFDLWEPLARGSAGKMAFWVSFQEGGQAILHTP